MSADLYEKLRQRLAGLRPEYLASLSARLEVLDSLRRTLERETSREPLAELHRLAHSIVGSSATFGFRQLSDRAKELELLIAPSLGAGAQSPPAAARVLECLGALAQSVREVLADNLLPAASGASGDPADR